MAAAASISPPAPAYSKARAALRLATFSLGGRASGEVLGSGLRGGEFE
jgi:hypothetical protein